ncbi:MAG TPA: ion transporter [Methanoregulaceae archaeon]|nr:ion transporter [Methanolinea sp.]MDD3090026.1 ion transporter [Methanoregulaceae archaeon]MDD5684238.1 ion transporter [Methanoregulaceae archaeon]HOP67026.1 ion transporter [Methanoregulaceae archaeon]HPJ73253.1 ion transporter [Methanoregulaceae archaeon]
MDTSAFRMRLYQILEPAKPGDSASYLFDAFITVVILISIVVMILGTVPQLQDNYHILFSILFFFSMTVFSIEYPLRLWSCTADPRYTSTVAGRLKWAVTPFAIIDLLAVLPFYLEVIVGINLTGLVVLRVFRLFKLVRYSESINLIIRVIKSQRNTLFTAYAVLFIALIASSTLMFEIEHPVQPDLFSSIPATMWWGIVTLTTVGYGDMVPVTPAGKVLGGAITLIGIGIFALPAGLLASGFTAELKRQVAEGEVTGPDRPSAVYLCPHCRKEILENELWRRD